MREVVLHENSAQHYNFLNYLGAFKGHEVFWILPLSFKNVGLASYIGDGLEKRRRDICFR
jgi:hypothetical protein